MRSELPGVQRVGSTAPLFRHKVFVVHAWVGSLSTDEPMVSTLFNDHEPGPSKRKCDISLRQLPHPHIRRNGPANVLEDRVAVVALPDVLHLAIQVDILL